MRSVCVCARVQIPEECVLCWYLRTADIKYTLWKWPSGTLPAPHWGTAGTRYGYMHSSVMWNARAHACTLTDHTQTRSCEWPCCKENQLKRFINLSLLGIVEDIDQGHRERRLGVPALTPPRRVRDGARITFTGEGRETRLPKNMWHSIKKYADRPILNNNNDNNGRYTVASSLVSSAGLLIVLVQRAHAHTHASIRWVKLPISV